MQRSNSNQVYNLIAKLTTEIGLAGAMACASVMAMLDMSRPHSSIPTWNQAWFIPLIISCCIAGVGFVIYIMNEHIDNSGISFMTAVLRPTSAAGTVMFGYVFVGLCKEACPSLADKIVCLTFAGASFVLMAFMFTGLVYEGAKSCYQCLKATSLL